MTSRRMPWPTRTKKPLVLSAPTISSPNRRRSASLSSSKRERSMTGISADVASRMAERLIMGSLRIGVTRRELKFVADMLDCRVANPWHGRNRGYCGPGIEIKKAGCERQGVTNGTEWEAIICAAAIARVGRLLQRGHRPYMIQGGDRETRYARGIWFSSRLQRVVMS